MSVPAWQRNESGVKFLDVFKRIRREMNLLMSRDYGIKPRTYSVKLLEEIYGVSEEDASRLEELFQKYNMTSSKIEKYPMWLIDAWRSEQRETVKLLGREIELANTTYIMPIKDIDETTRKEMARRQYLERRLHWDEAIGYCNVLKDQLQEVLDSVKDIKISQFQTIQELLQTEINLLKAVRASDNKLVKSILGQEI